MTDPKKQMLRAYRVGPLANRVIQVAGLWHVRHPDLGDGGTLFQLICGARIPVSAEEGDSRNARPPFAPACPGCQAADHLFARFSAKA